MKTSKGIDPVRLKALLHQMIDIYSPSGKEEEVLRYAEEYLKARNLPVVRQTVDENRFNLLVLPDDPDEMSLCFVGHVDTVPAHDLEDYGFYEEEEEVFGLGSADMKAGCAAMIEAFTVLREQVDQLPPIGLALVVGEEEESDGAKALMREFTFPWAIIGEPTNMMPCLGHYGYLEVLLRARGKRAHSSMPELGQNAVEHMLKLLLQVSQFAASSSDHMVCNIREMSSSSGGFVVPDTCEAYLDFHLPPESRLDTVKAKLELLVEAAGESISGLEASIRFEETHAGYYISPERLFVRKLKKVYEKLSLPWQPQDFRSHSDGNVLWAAGVDPIIIGPGRLETAHTSDESVEFAQVVEAAQLYLAVAHSL